MNFSPFAPVLKSSSQGRFPVPAAASPGPHHVHESLAAASDSSNQSSGNGTGRCALDELQLAVVHSSLRTTGLGI